MGLTVSPDQSDIQITLRSFLLGLGLSYSPPQISAVEIVAGQANRVPEPKGADFVIFTPIRRERISTNLDSYQEAGAFLGFIVANELLVTEGLSGSVIIGGAPLTGNGVAAGTTVLSQIAGSPGGAGAYEVSINQTVAPGILSFGGSTAMQSTKITFQIDVHGPNSADNAQIITTMFRDTYAVIAFANAVDGNGNPIIGVTPLLADDPTQTPFINAEDQYEDRYVIEAMVQADQVVSGISQQFADVVDVDVISVVEAYP